jgi:hypothetical protein
MGRHTIDMRTKLEDCYSVASNGCWEVYKYAGYRSGEGYARIPHRESGARVKLFAHVESYRLHKGEIPEGYEIDHLCYNKLCINPEHLEPVTPAENLARRRGRYARVI